MAGYQVKIVIEDTHPPVWRRVAIPEGISFKSLHDIIQILFGWEDYHLHDFSFSGAGNTMRITMPEDADGWKFLDETETGVDYFLQEYKWIRYTYDFGDDWKHKIILEKKLPHYDKSAAELIKFKGNNFEEDSGGVYFAQEALEFDKAYVTEKLAHCPLDFVEENAENLSDEELDDHYNEFVGKMDELLQSGEITDVKAVEDIKRMADFMTRAVKLSNKEKESQAKPEEIYKLLSEVKTFGKEYGIEFDKEDDLEQYISKKDRTPSVLQNRVHAWDRFANEDLEQTGVTIMNSKKSVLQLVCDFDEIEGRDYCKYIVADTDSATVEQYASRFFEKLVEFPEVLGYVFEKEDFDEAWKVLNAKNGMFFTSLNRNTITILIALGFMDFGVEKINRRVHYFLYRAKDAKELFQKHTEKEWETIIETCHRQSIQLKKLVQMYKMIELKTLIQKYHVYVDSKTSDEMLTRCIYWSGTFRKELKTANMHDGRIMVGLDFIDLEKIVRDMLKEPPEITYKEFTKEEFEHPAFGIGETNAVWNDYHLFLQGLYDSFSDSEIDDYFMQNYKKVIEGCTLEELYEQSDSIFLDASDYAQYWLICYIAYMETGIPKYHGYSRAEYAKEKGIDPSSLSGISKEKCVKHIGKRTHLYEFPPEYQYECYLAVSDKSKASDRLLDFKKYHHIENVELDFLLGLRLLRDKRMDKANEIFQALYEEEPDDYLLQKMISELSLKVDMDQQSGYRQKKKTKKQEIFSVWDFDEEGTPIVPYRREGQKIGRNDPCPCGSGKKYKKCCGKGI